MLITGSVLSALSGLALAPLLGGTSTAGVLVFLCIELALMGVTFAPMGALLPELFPTRVRYTGAATAYNVGGILGASLAPAAAQWLLASVGLVGVGLYVTAASLVSLVALLTMRETRDARLPEG